VSADRADDKQVHDTLASLLPWFVGGSLDEEQARRVAEHLEACGDCRGEAAALASMRDSLRLEDRTEHIEATDLVDWEAGEKTDPSRADRITQHLRECSACREDYEALVAAGRASEDARDEEMPPAVVPGPAWRRPRIRTLAALAAAAAILAAVAVPVIRALRAIQPTPEEQQRPTAITTVTLSPSQRGAEGPASLPGNGPWSIDVLLPFGAAEGVYEVAILEEGGAAVPSLGGRAEGGRDARLRVMVPSLPRRGRYILRLLPPGSGAAPYLYSFLWQDDPAAPEGQAPR